jgi:sulfatase maturation enzyme AslB (radical SAM superfamily)
LIFKFIHDKIRNFFENKLKQSDLILNANENLKLSNFQFYSLLFNKLMLKLSEKFPNFELCLQSNALMAEKNWHRISHLESSIQHIVVSIDAATAQTYKIVRRGGTWSQLISAMTFLQNKKSKLGIEIRTRMVVQNANIDEISEFYQFSKDSTLFFSADH